MTNSSGDEELGAAFSDPVLASLFSELRMVADQPVPPVGDELAAILAGATPRFASAGRTRSQRLALVALVSTGALTAGVGAAAATDRLPAPLHRVVAKVVNGVTPFEMPKEPAESEDVNGPMTPAGDDATSNPATPVTSDDDDEERDHAGAGEDDSSTGDDADHSDADGADYSDGDDGNDGDSEDDSDSDGDGGDDDSEDDSDSDDEGDSEDDDSEDDGDGSDGGDDSESDD